MQKRLRQILWKERFRENFDLNFAKIYWSAFNNINFFYLPKSKCKWSEICWNVLQNTDYLAFQIPLTLDITYMHIACVLILTIDWFFVNSPKYNPLPILPRTHIYLNAFQVIFPFPSNTKQNKMYNNFSNLLIVVKSPQENARLI